VYLPRMAIHTATGEASRVYSISLFTFHTKVSMHTASLEIVHAHRVRVMASRKQQSVVYWPVLSTVDLRALDGRSVISMPVCDDLRSANSDVQN